MILMSLGDPLSVTIECLVQMSGRLSSSSQPIVLVGSRWHLEYQCRLLKTDLPIQGNLSRDSFGSTLGPGLWFYNLNDPSLRNEDPRTLSPLQRGRIAYAALSEVAELMTLSSSKVAVVTGPIDKFACQKAGFAFPGQTEFFEAKAGREGIMLLAGPRLKVGLVTNHLALKDVASHVTESRILAKLDCLTTTLQKIYKIAQPRIAVTGLNPHCGDGGLFGLEEKQVLSPAIAAGQADDRVIIGPLPADTAFFRCYTGEFDAVLAMYHDQGLGPLKTVHFYDAVNITGGLPFLRISPDHGPAANLFMQGQAKIDSLANAIQLASEYLE